MKTKNLVKKSVALAMGALMIASAASISASAKTLDECFSGTCEIICKSVDACGNCTWTKRVTAKTIGYSGQHYVRAYIGGSSSSAYGAIVDSRRKWSYEDVTATVSGGSYTGSALLAKMFIETGYAKYGT